MSKMKELYEKVAGNSTLQKKFSEIAENAESLGEKALGEKLISFAKEAGYDITLDELNAFFQELAESQQGVLSEAELDMVAGGKSRDGVFLVVISVVSLGLYCSSKSSSWKGQIKRPAVQHLSKNLLKGRRRNFSIPGNVFRF